MATIQELPLNAAETHVDWDRLDAYITTAREEVERLIRTTALQYATDLHHGDGIPSYRSLSALEARIQMALYRVYTFGYKRARAELRALRRAKGLRPLLADDAPRFMQEIGNWVRSSARLAAGRFNESMLKRFGLFDGNEWDRLAYLRLWAQRAAHNLAIEVVGRTLNAGRRLAAMGRGPGDRHAAVWAMRSERLDKNTCGPCKLEHGEVYEVGSMEFFLHEPPAECLGLGRCRGIYVFSDDRSDFE